MGFASFHDNFREWIPFSGTDWSERSWFADDAVTRIQCFLLGELFGAD